MPNSLRTGHRRPTEHETMKDDTGRRAAATTRRGGAACAAARRRRPAAPRGTYGSRVGRGICVCVCVCACVCVWERGGEASVRRCLASGCHSATPQDGAAGRTDTKRCGRATSASFRTRPPCATAAMTGAPFSLDDGRGAHPKSLAWEYPHSKPRPRVRSPPPSLPLRAGLTHTALHDTQAAD